MKPDATWQRDIWNECSYWDHKVDTTVFDHYSSVPYSDDKDDDQRILWLSIPKDKQDYPTIVWFHGGGFTVGKHECPKEIYDTGEFAVVEAKYRLSPDVQAPTYIQDGVDALVWTLQHIADFGGNPDKVFVGGMSAGAYLGMIISMDPRWLAPYGIDHKQLAGIVSLSGQVSTHFLVAEQLNLPPMSPYAPMVHIASDLPPMLLVTGDAMRDVEGRTEENARMAALLRKLGHPQVECHALGNQDHPGAFVNGAPLVVPFMRKVLGSTREQ